MKSQREEFIEFTADLASIAIMLFVCWFMLAGIYQLCGAPIADAKLLATGGTNAMGGVWLHRLWKKGAN